MSKDNKKVTKDKNSRHIDCAWLVPAPDGYRCCDIRSPFHEKGMDREESLKEACPNYHPKDC